MRTTSRGNWSLRAGFGAWVLAILVGIGAPRFATLGMLAALGALGLALRHSGAPRWRAQSAVSVGLIALLSWRSAESVGLGRTVEALVWTLSVTGCAGWLVVMLGRHREALVSALAESERGRLETQAALRSRDAFLSTASHELKTPLTAILTWAQVLRLRGADAHQRARALEVIEHSARLEAQIVDGLLDANSASRSTLPLANDVVRLENVIRGSLDTLRGVVERLDVRLELRLEARPRVMGDIKRLEQACFAVLHNALKHSARGGKVRVTVGGSGSMAWVTFEDSGPGFSREYLAVPFVRFAAGRAPGHGFGVGLSLARDLVARHQGRVMLDNLSALGGARVRWELPLHEERMVVARSA